VVVQSDISQVSHVYMHILWADSDSDTV
jgi:hypothetical protein